ncbi:MAG: hypothetical protein L6R40_001535 [Gallowayella cf. fulva]|nr:MAG: hypothetical protein L6R40_001535 [Xanthomendoza cf. fulva]
MHQKANISVSKAQSIINLLVRVRCSFDDFCTTLLPVLFSPHKESSMLPIYISAVVSTLVTFGEARSLHPLEVTAYIIMDLTGLNAMSRVLWLESQKVTEANAAQTAYEIDFYVTQDLIG